MHKKARPHWMRVPGSLTNSDFWAQTQFPDRPGRAQPLRSPGIIARQVQPLPGCPIHPPARHRQEVPPHRLHGGRAVTFGPAQPLEPRPQIAGQQQRLKERHGGQALRRGNLAQGQIVEPFADRFLHPRPPCVEAPHSPGRRVSDWPPAPGKRNAGASSVATAPPPADLPARVGAPPQNAAPWASRAPEGKTLRPPSRRPVFRSARSTPAGESWDTAWPRSRNPSDWLRENPAICRRKIRRRPAAAPGHVLNRRSDYKSKLSSLCAGREARLELIGRILALKGKFFQTIYSSPYKQ